MSSCTILALSGGVDSSTAAALTLADGCDGAVAVTLGLWGGEREYLDWTADFDRVVVGAFVDSAEAGRTANPCITCNRAFKADRLFAWAGTRGFDRVVTGHYARVAHTVDGPRIARAVDAAKDQSYVLCAFTPDQISRLHLPLGSLTKAQVRAHAHRLGLAAADQPESMGLCFSPRKVLAAAALGNVAIVDAADQRPLGEVPKGLAAVGQRKGLGISGGTAPRYVIDVRPDAVVVGDKAQLLVDATPVTNWQWTGGGDIPRRVTFQTSAHGAATPATLTGGEVRWDAPRPRVAPGQIVVAYAPYLVNGGPLDCVVGWGEAT